MFQFNSSFQKLFSKCGPLIQARFDTNEFGQYLGTATVIYAKASAALRAINDYNGASLDNRVMKVYYAEEKAKPEKSVASTLHSFKKPGQQLGHLQRQERQQRSLKIRRSGGRIQKNRDRPESSGET